MIVVTTKTYTGRSNMSAAALIEKMDIEEGLDSLTLDDAIDQVVHNYQERRDYTSSPSSRQGEQELMEWIHVEQSPTRYIYEDCPDQHTQLIHRLDLAGGDERIYQIVPFTNRADYMELHTTALGLMGKVDLANEDWGPDGLYQQIMGHLAALVDITPNKKWSFTTDDD